MTLEVEEYLKENEINNFGWVVEYKTKKAAIIGSIAKIKFTMHDDIIYFNGKNTISFFRT